MLKVGSATSSHNVASFPVLARNPSRNIVNRYTAPIKDIFVKIYIRKFASAKSFQQGGSSPALRCQTDMNSSTNKAHGAKTISNPEPSARYDHEWRLGLLLSVTLTVLSSVLLISSLNEILLLHRVKTATSYASAHVFPGGHLDSQDGEIPPITDVRIHDDSRPYRMAAIRECFEESGILLARGRNNPNELLILSDEDREQGRRAVHQDKVDFQAWVEQRGGTPDIGM